MTSKIITENNRNDDIEIIEGTLIFSEYHAEYYRNTNQNKKNYIVMHEDDEGEYIDCLLLNINIFNYYNGAFYKDSFSMDYLNEFNLFHHNGYLGVVYDEDHAKNNIIGFFKECGNYFIKDYKPYEIRVIINLEDRVIRLYESIIKEIELLNKLDLLFWDK